VKFIKIPLSKMGKACST